LPNKLNRKYDSTLFEVDFFIDDKEYIYAIDYDGKRIKREELKQNGKIIFSVVVNAANNEYALNFEKMSSRQYPSNELKKVFEVECCENAFQIKSFLNKIVDKYPGLNPALNEVKKYLLSQMNASQAISYLPTDNDTLKKISDIITRLDIDINRIERDARFELDTRFISYHKDISGEEVAFDLYENESQGTKILFHRLTVILDVLEKGGTLFIDELDRSLHPFLIDEVVKMFKAKDTNPNNAQLIITTHSPYILENKTLRVSEVGFVNKTLNDGTTLCYLSEFDDIRNTTDFVKRYLDGRLTGVPLVY
jgi:AAA15 family ATPase/GTPase